MEEHPKRWKQSKGEDRTELKKEATRFRVDLGHREKVHEKIQRKVRYLFRVSAQIEEEEMEEQFNREAHEGWRFAADAARITDRRTGNEDRKHTSGGVFAAVDSSLRAVVGAEEWAIDSVPGNEGRIAQAWENARGCLRVFSMCV